MAQHPNSERVNTEPISAGGTLTTGETWAIAISVVWIFVAAFVFWMTWPDPAPARGFALSWFILVALAVLLPAVLVWVAVASSHAVRNLRRELFQARTNIDRLAAMLAKKPDEKAASAAPQPLQIPPAPPPNDASPSRFESKRAVSRLITPRAAPQTPADQPGLALDTPDDIGPPIARPDLIKALHFPDDENDTEGFAALRRALRDRGARKLVQASQDVLTLMSQDGVYMDDLTPAPISADVWRRFAKGARGKSVDQLGGIHDQTYLSAISRRAREDAIFRDVVHHFLRQFDQFLVTFEEGATDTDLLALADTRTSRAFMVLARTTGTFD